MNPPANTRSLCVSAAIKDKKNSYFKFHMFSKQEAFNPADTDYSAIPEEMYQKFQEQYDKNAIKRLKKRGFTIIPPVATA